MDAAKRLAEKHNLQDLVPLNALSESRFAEIAQKIVVEEVKKGKYLFRKGDRDNQSVFLLDGKIILIDGHRKVIGEVEAGTDSSRYPIASQQPRALSVRAVTKVVIARIDSGLLDVFLTWDQDSGTEATEIKAEDNEDWMTRMLQSDAFSKIPPAMIQRLLIKMESCPVQKGDAVIRQGDPGDYFYTIHKGTCAVTRVQGDGEEITLAELSDGDCFGEESLVSDTSRNASVTMTSDGLLMRLAKKDFVELLQKPLVSHVGYEEAVDMVEEGAVWVDVRSPGEYENNAFEDSVNIPLEALRGEIPELVYNARYIICCDTGELSASAAFILSHKGFEVLVLDGGINALPADTAHDDTTLTQDDAVGGEPPVDEAEIIDLKAKQDAARDVQVDAMETASTGQDSALAEQSAELEALRAEVASLRQQVEDHSGIEQQLAGNEEVVNSLQQEATCLKEQKDLLSEQYVTLQEEYEKKLLQLSQELEQSQEASASLQAKSESGDHEKQQQVEEFKRKQEALQQHVSQLEEQLAGLANKYESVLAERDSDREQLALLQAAETSTQEQEEAQAASSAELESLRAELVSLQSEKQAVEEQAGSNLAEQQERSEQLQAALDAAESEKQDTLAQMEALRQSQAESREQLDQSAEEVGLARREAAELKQELESLQAEKRELEDSQSESQATEEALQRQQQEWDGERAALQDELGTLRDSVAELHGQLDKSREEAASEQARLEEELGSRSDKAMKQVEELEVVQEELRQQREQAQEELRSALAERDEIRLKLESEMQQGGALRQEAENLNDRMSALAAEKDAEISSLNTQLQAEQMRAEEAAQQQEASMAGNEELRARLAQQEETAAKLRNEVESQAQQLEAAQLELQQAVEHARSAELESEQTLSKAWDDLNRKNDTEKELQGQITRLRKKLEQSTTDLQQVREEAREAAAQARDALHAERKERADERAQMAARQRELKEQLLAVAGQHEELQSSQKGALAQAESAARNDERARLQEVLETHAQAEDQLAAMRQELAQAREETERAVSEERQRHTADLDLARAQKSELDAAVAEQESRLQELTTERDAAVSERQSMREQLNSLRAEVEIARGVINASGDGEVEDPVRLRAELEEAKRNLDIAIRVRSEAESARDSALAERDAMQQQLEDAAADGMPLSIPSLDEQDGTDTAEVSPPDEAAESGLQASDAAATVPVGARIREWLGRAVGIRARPEAESVRDSALAEGDAMQRQLEGADVAGMPLTIPSLDEQDGTDPAEVSPPVADGNNLPEAAADSGTQAGDTAATVPWRERIRSWLGKAIGLGVATLVLFAAWYLLENRDSLFPDLGTRTVGILESLSGDADNAAPATATSADTPAASRDPSAVEKPEKPAVAAEKQSQAEPDKAPAPEIAPLAAGRSFSDALRNGGRGPVVVELPAASYMMGSRGGAPNFSERPRHEVTLPAFAIGKHEVTFAEYDRFARATGRRLPYDEGWGRGKRPVINVSWKDATAYAAWLSKQTGHTYRLPTEAQWEFAARAGTATPYWWPKSSKEIPANCFDCGSQWDGKTSAAVGSFSPNAFGLHDTAGNVQEWTQDCYHKSYKGAPSDGSAWQSAGCSQRVVRGGAYTSPLGSLRNARRVQFDQESRMDNIGFRVVRIK